MDSGLISNYIIIGLVLVLPAVIILKKTRLIQRLTTKFTALPAKKRTRVVAIGLLSVVGFIIFAKIIMSAIFALLVMSGVPCGESGGTACSLIDKGFFQVFIDILLNRVSF